MMSSTRINGPSAKINRSRPSTTATSSEWATISSESVSESIDMQHLPANPTISTLTDNSSTATLCPRGREDSTPRPFDAGINRPRTFSLCAVNTLMNGDNGNKDELSRISSANRHSIANPFDPLNGSYSYNNCHSPVNPFEPAPRPAATAPSSSSPPTNHYHPAAQAHIRSPSPVLMNQHVENLSHSNRRASHAPYYNIRSPPRRANGIGSCYPGSPRLRESSPHLRNMGFAARRASVRDYHDEEAGCHSSQHNDWVMWEQQRLSMARESETRNKRNVALAIVISFVVLVACMVGLGFLLAYDNRLSGAKKGGN